MVGFVFCVVGGVEEDEGDVGFVVVVVLVW